MAGAPGICAKAWTGKGDDQDVQSERNAKRINGNWSLRSLFRAEYRYQRRWIGSNITNPQGKWTERRTEWEKRFVIEIRIF
jgi:hypothetical protein